MGMAAHSCSGLENSTDSRVHGVTKSWTRLSNFTFTAMYKIEKQKNLLYSTGSYAQYLLIIYNEMER